MNKKLFQKLIWDYYKKNKRDFPWRETKDPYKILVSELMLQQTQTSRVLPKYAAFINKFPTIKTLASANLSEVLLLWSGLGYNRRAKYLHQAAIYLHQNHNNQFPKTSIELQKIPGIGPYTARAILVFSFNQPEVFIETNIRRIFIHHFFKDKKNISDNDLFTSIEQTLDNKNPRDWYYALMDYGSQLIKQIPNPNHQSKHYTKQSKFEGSIRKIRGQILKQLIATKQLTKIDLCKHINYESPERITTALQGLIKDQLIFEDNDFIKLK